jgi:hypothetical protein
MAECHIRMLKDRRARPTPMLSRFTLQGRRASLRRIDDRRKGGYVDRYGSGLLLLVLLILTLTSLDVISTALILNAGGREVSPVLNYALGHWGEKVFIRAHIDMQRPISYSGAALQPGRGSWLPGILHHNVHPAADYHGGTKCVTQCNTPLFGLTHSNKTVFSFL